MHDVFNEFIRKGGLLGDNRVAAKHRPRVWSSEIGSGSRACIDSRWNDWTILRGRDLNRPVRWIAQKVFDIFQPGFDPVDLLFTDEWTKR